MFLLFFEKLKEVRRKDKIFRKKMKKQKDFLELFVQLYYNFSKWVRRIVRWIRIVYFGFQ